MASNGQPGPIAEDWVQMDPRSFSDPYASAPVYSSGPTEAPTVVPPGYLPGGGVSSPVESSQHSEPQPLQMTSHGTPVDDRQPEKGDLHMKERRSWKTWQLVTAVVIALVVGMAINGSTGSASGASSGSGSGGGYKLPAPAGSPTTTPTTTAAGKGSTASTGSTQSSPTTTTAGSTAGASASTTTPTSGAAGAAASPTTTVAVGPATILVPSTQQTGNWTSPAFTIAAGTWNIGWAFQCAPAPTGTPAFQIFVVAAGSSPGSTPTVTSSAASGSSVTPQTTTGSQELIVQSTAACRWAVKVTGFSG